MPKKKMFAEKYGVSGGKEEDTEDDVEKEEFYLLFKRKVFSTSGSLRVNIPKVIIESLGLESGDTIYIAAKQYCVIMAKKRKDLEHCVLSL